MRNDVELKDPLRIEGKPERDATYAPIMEYLRKRYPNVDDRGGVSIMVPGSGLGE